MFFVCWINPATSTLSPCLTFFSHVASRSITLPLPCTPLHCAPLPCLAFHPLPSFLSLLPSTVMAEEMGEEKAGKGPAAAAQLMRQQHEFKQHQTSSRSRSRSRSRNRNRNRSSSSTGQLKSLPQGQQGAAATRRSIMKQANKHSQKQKQQHQPTPPLLRRHTTSTLSSPYSSIPAALSTQSQPKHRRPGSSTSRDSLGVITLLSSQRAGPGGAEKTRRRRTIQSARMLRHSPSSQTLLSERRSLSARMSSMEPMGGHTRGRLELEFVGRKGHRSLNPARRVLYAIEQQLPSKHRSVPLFCGLVHRGDVVRLDVVPGEERLVLIVHREYELAEKWSACCQFGFRTGAKPGGSPGQFVVSEFAAPRHFAFCSSVCMCVCVMSVCLSRALSPSLSPSLPSLTPFPHSLPSLPFPHSPSLTPFPHSLAPLLLALVSALQQHDSLERG